MSDPGDETDDQPVSDPDAVDDRVRDERRITISREPAFAHALVRTYPDDIYETEQECWEEAARERVVRYRRGTLPEQFLADLLGRTARNSGSATPTNWWGWSARTRPATS
jgi:hypothetical protein